MWKIKSTFIKKLLTWTQCCLISFSIDSLTAITLNFLTFCNLLVDRTSFNKSMFSSSMLIVTQVHRLGESPIRDHLVNDIVKVTTT